MEKPVVEISAADAAARMRSGGMVLLDCREPEELQLARVEGAKHIPMGDIPVRLPELDADVEIAVMCHHGVRSRNVAAWLTAHGFERVASVRGGIHAWSAEVDTSVPTY